MIVLNWLKILIKLIKFVIYFKHLSNILDRERHILTHGRRTFHPLGNSDTLEWFYSPSGFAWKLAFRMWASPQDLRLLREQYYMYWARSVYVICWVHLYDSVIYIIHWSIIIKSSSWHRQRRPLGHWGLEDCHTPVLPPGPFLLRHPGPRHRRRSWGEIPQPTHLVRWRLFTQS